MAKSTNTTTKTVINNPSNQDTYEQGDDGDTTLVQK